MPQGLPGGGYGRFWNWPVHYEFLGGGEILSSSQFSGKRGPLIEGCRDISSRREISGYKHNVLSEADHGAFKLDRLMLGWRLCTLFWSKFSEFASQGEYFYFTTVFVASYCRIPGHSFASHRIWMVSFVFRVVLSSVGIYEWVPKWVIKSLPIFGFGL